MWEALAGQNIFPPHHPWRHGRGLDNLEKSRALIG